MEEEFVLPTALDPIARPITPQETTPLRVPDASQYATPTLPTIGGGVNGTAKPITPEEEARKISEELSHTFASDYNREDPTKSEIFSLDKERYDGFIIDPRKSNDYDLQASGQQSKIDRIMNDTVVFGAGLAAGFGAAYTSVVDLVKDQSFTPGVDSLTASLADWKTRVDEEHTNFETEFDKENPILSMILPAVFTGSSKGWGEMARSLSMGVGTGLGLLSQQLLLAVATEGTGNIPAFAATIRGAMAMKTGATAASMVGRLGQLAKAGTAAMNTTQKTLLAADLTKEVAQRYLMAMGEAEFEANETRTNIRANYIKDFALKNNRIPTAEELSHVENIAEQAHDARYTLNMATLMVTGGPFMKGVLKPLQATRQFQDKLVEKGMVAGLELAENSAGKIIFSKGKSLTGDFWVKNKIGKVLKTPVEYVASKKGLVSSIQGMEAVEEGLQFLYDKSVDNYYTSKLDEKTNNRVKASILDTALGIGQQLYKDKGLLLSQEGIQSMLSGVFSGTGQAMFTKALGQFKIGRNEETGKYGVEYIGKKERNKYKEELETAGENILKNISTIVGSHKSLKQSPVDSINSVSSVATLDNMLGFTTHEIYQEQIRNKRVFDSLIDLVKTGQNEVALDILKKDMAALSPMQFGELLGVDITSEEQKRELIESTTEHFNTIKKSFDRVQSVFRPPLDVSKDPKKLATYNHLKDALTYHEYTADKLTSQIEQRVAESPLMTSTREAKAYINGDSNFFETLKKNKQSILSNFNAVVPEAVTPEMTSQMDKLRGEIDFIDDIIATIDEEDNKEAIIDSFQKVSFLSGTPLATSQEAEKAYMQASDIKYLEDKHKTHVKTFDALVSAKEKDMNGAFVDYLLEAQALNDAINEIVDDPEVAEEETEEVPLEEVPVEEEEVAEEPPAGPGEPPTTVKTTKKTVQKLSPKQEASFAKLKPLIDNAKKAKVINKEVDGVMQSVYSLAGKFYKRVTNFIDPVGVQFESEASVSNVRNSLPVGNVVDLIARGVFNNSNFTYKKFLASVEGDKASFSPEEQKQFEFIKTEKIFNTIKDEVLAAKDYLNLLHTKNSVAPVYITDELLASVDSPIDGLDGVAGKTDMVLIDGAGDVFIYDFKNVIAKLDNDGNLIPYNPAEQVLVKKIIDGQEIMVDVHQERGMKWTKQQTVYASFIEKATGVLPKINIIVFGTNYNKEPYTGETTREAAESFYPTPSDLKVEYEMPIQLGYDADNVKGLKELLVEEQEEEEEQDPDEDTSLPPFPDFPPIDLSVISKEDAKNPTLESKIGAALHEVIALGATLVGIVKYNTKKPDPTLVKTRKNFIRKLKTDKNLKLNFKTRVKADWETSAFNGGSEAVFTERGLALNNDLPENQPSYVLTYIDEETGKEIIVAEAKHPNRLTINPIASAWLKTVLPKNSKLRAAIEKADPITIYDLYRESKEEQKTNPEIENYIARAIWGQGVAQDYTRASNYVEKYFQSYENLIKELETSKDPVASFRNHFELDYVTFFQGQGEREALDSKIYPLEISVNGSPVTFEGVIYQNKKFHQLREGRFYEIIDKNILEVLNKIVEEKIPTDKAVATDSVAIHNYKGYLDSNTDFNFQYVYRVPTGSHNAVALFGEALEAAKLADPKDKFSTFKNMIVIKENMSDKNTIITIRDNDVAISPKSVNGESTKPIKTISVKNNKIVLKDLVNNTEKEIVAYDPNRNIQPEDFQIEQDYRTVFSFVRPKAPTAKPKSTKKSKVKTAIAKNMGVTVTDNSGSITRNFVELENAIVDFDSGIQDLFDSPTIKKYENAVGNLEYDLSADITPGARILIESMLRDVQNSFTVTKKSLTLEDKKADIERRRQNWLGRIEQKGDGYLAATDDEYTYTESREEAVEWINARHDAELKVLDNENNLKNESLDVSLPSESTEENNIVEADPVPVVPSSTNTDLVFSPVTTDVGEQYKYVFADNATEEQRAEINTKLDSLKNNAHKGMTIKKLESQGLVRKTRITPAQRNTNQIVSNLEQEVKNLKKQCHGLS